MTMLRDDAALADWEGEGGSLDPAREPVPVVDGDLTYLGLTWLTSGETAEPRSTGESMSRAEARGMWRSHLTIERFRSLLTMRDVFRELRRAGEAEP